jgi:hypothetical protein
VHKQVGISRIAQAHGKHIMLGPIGSGYTSTSPLGFWSPFPNRYKMNNNRTMIKLVRNFNQQKHKRKYQDNAMDYTLRDPKMEVNYSHLAMSSCKLNKNRKQSMDKRNIQRTFYW